MSTSRFSYSASAIALLASLTLGAGAVRAATAADDTQAQPTASVGEVVVTAQKRNERQVNVPISIAVFSERQLERQNITSSADLQNVTPGLRMDQTGVFAVPTIRGVGTPVTGSGASPTAIYVDGIYQQDPAGNIFDLNNVNSVQVLKGPQGTLFGRNSEGGAILITTLDPSRTLDIRAQGTVGNYGERRGNFYISGPLTDTLAANLDVYARHNDGYLQNVFSGSNQDGHNNTFTISTKLLFAPTDRMKFTLKLEHIDISDPSAHNYVAAVDPVTGRGFAQANSQAGAIVATDPYTNSADRPSTNRNLKNTASLKALFDFEWATLTSYSSMVQQHDLEFVDQDASNKVISEFEFSNSETYYQQEFDLAHQGGGPLDWVTGLYFSHDKAVDPAFFAVTTTGKTNTASTALRADAFAAFGDATYNFLQNWFVTVGGRYSIERKRLNLFASQTAPLNVGNYSHTWYAFTPRAVLRYQFDHNTSTYFSYSRGQKSGLFNTTGRVLPVAPENLTSYELGFKTQQSNWHFEAAAFYYTYVNLQFQNTVAGLGSITSNAGNARSVGGEASVAWAPTSEISVNAGVAYTHATYTSFKTAVIAIPCNGAPLPSSNYTVTSACRGLDLGDAVGTSDVSGRYMIRAPKWTGTLSADYRHPTAIGIFDLSGNLYYSSRVFFQADDAAIFSQKPYVLLNLNASWSPANERVKISIWGTNVTNVVYLNQASPDAASARLRYAAPSRYGVTVAFKY